MYFLYSHCGPFLPASLQRKYTFSPSSVTERYANDQILSAFINAFASISLSNFLCIVQSSGFPRRLGGVLQSFSFVVDVTEVFELSAEAAEVFRSNTYCSVEIENSKYFKPHPLMSTVNSMQTFLVVWYSLPDTRCIWMFCKDEMCKCIEVNEIDSITTNAQKWITAQIELYKECRYNLRFFIFSSRERHKIICLCPFPLLLEYSYTNGAIVSITNCTESIRFQFLLTNTINDKLHFTFYIQESVCVFVCEWI